jgi:hypothetical protein
MLELRIPRSERTTPLTPIKEIASTRETTESTAAVQNAIRTINKSDVSDDWGSPDSSRRLMPQAIAPEKNAPFQKKPAIAQYDGNRSSNVGDTTLASSGELEFAETSVMGCHWL